MAEGRMLKRNVSWSKKLAKLKSDSARLLWTWLNPFVDIEGRYRANPIIIKGNIFPIISSWTTQKIKKHLKELDEVGLIILYTDDEEEYIQLTKFHDHQTLRRNREAASQIPPPPPKSKATPGPTPGSTPGLTPAKVKLREVKVKVKLREVKDFSLTEKEILKELEEVEGFPRNSSETIRYIRKLIEEFPKVDPLEAIKDKVAWWIKKPLEKDSNPYLQLRNWFKKATEFKEEQRLIGQTKIIKTQKEEEKESQYIEARLNKERELVKKGLERDSEQFLLEMKNWNTEWFKKMRG